MSYSTCYHCNRPWNVVQGHSTKFSKTEGCFPLCEECWQSLTPETRMPFYQKLINSWLKFCTDEAMAKKVIADAELIRAAVREGK